MTDFGHIVLDAEVAGALWSKVLQTCGSGRSDWSEIPAAGSSTKGMKLPAVLLDVISQDAAAFSPPAVPAALHAPGAHQH